MDLVTWLTLRPPTQHRRVECRPHLRVRARHQALLALILPWTPRTVEPRPVTQAESRAAGSPKLAESDVAHLACSVRLYRHRRSSRARRGWDD